MKPCIKCEKQKPLDEFYAHAQMADGRLNKCKSCCRIDVKQNRDARREYYLDYDRNRPNKAERCKQTIEYHKTEKGKLVKAKAMRSYRAKHPFRYKAVNMVNNAIRSGELSKPLLCETCNCEKELQAHHCDYNKPLDVMWLCVACHQEWHRNNKAIDAVA